MKETKKEGCQITAFYQGGVKFHASVTHTKGEAESMIEEALVEKKPAVKLDTVNEAPEVSDDCLIMLLDKLLFISITKVNDSGIVTLPRNIQ
jgi:hypothetical protein